MAQTTADSLPGQTVGEPITIRAVASVFAAGLAGLLAMLPFIAGLPVWLGLFELRPVAGFVFLVGADPSTILPIFFFLVGGVVVLPLFFLVTATYLPPAEPRFLRGLSISVVFWPGFVIVYFPFADAVTNSAFLVVTLCSHLVYGLVLGVAFHRLSGIPEHEV